jgi:hypothetical protein
MVSPHDHVVMNHQNQTRTNGIWGHVRYNYNFSCEIFLYFTIYTIRQSDNYNQNWLDLACSILASLLEMALGFSITKSLCLSQSTLHNLIAILQLLRSRLNAISKDWIPINSNIILRKNYINRSDAHNAPGWCVLLWSEGSLAPASKRDQLIEATLSHRQIHTLGTTSTLKRLTIINFQQLQSRSLYISLVLPVRCSMFKYTKGQHSVVEARAAGSRRAARPTASASGPPTSTGSLSTRRSSGGSSVGWRGLCPGHEVQRHRPSGCWARTPPCRCPLLTGVSPLRRW